MATKSKPESSSSGFLADLPTDRLQVELRNLLGALGQRTLSTVASRVGGATDRLTDYAKQSGGPGLVAAATGAEKLAEGKSPTRAAFSAATTNIKEKAKGLFGGGKKGGKGQKLKVTNIVESIDVGVPLRLAYNQWTQFGEFSSFMKKVENVEAESDEKLNWKAQVFWSHRTWESTITEQIPDKRIVWTSKGAKGHVDGAVTFHEIEPEPSPGFSWCSNTTRRGCSSGRGIYGVRRAAAYGWSSSTSGVRSRRGPFSTPRKSRAGGA